MDRTQFTFYDSFYHGIKGLRTRGEQAAALFAICEYALYGTEPGNLPGSAGAVLAMARPILDAARRKAEAGKKGGSKPEASRKQAEAKPKQGQGQNEKTPKQVKEQVKEQVQVQDKEQMLLSPPSSDEEVVDNKPAAAEAGAGKAVDVYMAKINPTPSPTSMRELLAFEQELGTDVCLRAIDAALDANVRNWHYVRAILENKQAQGIRSGEDWDRQEAERMNARHRKTAMAAAEESGDGFRAPVDLGDLDQLLEELGGELEEWR